SSSLLLLPTSRFLLSGNAILLFNISSNTLGAILHPHPAPWEYCVSLIEFEARSSESGVINILAYFPKVNRCFEAISLLIFQIFYLCGFSDAEMKGRASLNLFFPFQNNC